MKRLTLEKQIAGIIKDGKIISSEEKWSVYGEGEIRTIQQGTFKCTIPMKSVDELLKISRSISRKPSIKFPIPITQKILAFLYNNKGVVPFYKEMAEGKGRRWFENRIYENFPDNAKQILKEAVYGTQSDRKYAMSTVPLAWIK